MTRIVVTENMGRRLFADGTGMPALELLESSRFRSGVVLLRYAPA